MGASLLVQANPDDDVKADILAFFDHLVAENPELYRHKPGQPDNAPSRIRALLAQTQISVPVRDVQSLYLFEHREAPETRRLLAHYVGEALPDETKFTVM